jgi:hypothetical protein
MFAAGRNGDFDLESTVTILQQDFRPFGPGRALERQGEARRTRRSQARDWRIIKETTDRVPAKELGKR